MDKTKAIELLRIAVPQDESFDEEGLFLEAVNMAIEALKNKDNDWIPMSEHPPYENGIYIATILYEEEYYVERLLYSKGKWMPIDSLNFVGIKGVIAWKMDDYYRKEKEGAK